MPLAVHRLSVDWVSWADRPLLISEVALGLLILLWLILLCCAIEVLTGDDKAVGFPFSAAIWVKERQLSRVFLPLSEEPPRTTGVGAALFRVWAGLRTLVRIGLLVLGGPLHAISSLAIPLYAVLVPVILVGGGVHQGLGVTTGVGKLVGGVTLLTICGGLILLYRKGIPRMSTLLTRGSAAEREERSRRLGGAFFLGYFSLLTMAVSQIDDGRWLSVEPLSEVRSFEELTLVLSGLWGVFIAHGLFYSIAFGVYDSLFKPWGDP
ncbi:MAG: hypothetical protein VX498_06960 [Myxococcota bacterium]|nr:hypothetical protein [Myxococcota bacterium]